MLLTFAFSMFRFVRTFAFTTMRTSLMSLIVSCMHYSFYIIIGWSVWVGSRTDEELLSNLWIGKHCTVAMLIKIAVITV